MSGTLAAVILIVSAGPGGGYDTYARALAPVMSAHIKNTVTVKNMSGAGGLKAANWLYSQAPADGSTIGMFQSSVAFAPLFGNEAAQFDAMKFKWIGAMSSSSAVCITWGQSGIKSWQDITTRQTIVGGSGSGAQNETLPTLLNALFETKFKVVSGYKSGNEIFLAMERGEVDGRCGNVLPSVALAHPNWILENRIAIPVTFSAKRNPAWPDTPSIMEMASPEQREVLEIVLAPSAIDRPIVAPPGTPARVVDQIRKAFMFSIYHPDFKDAAAKLRLEINPSSGQEVADVIAKAYRSKPAAIQAAQSAMGD